MEDQQKVAYGLFIHTSFDDLKRP